MAGNEARFWTRVIKGPACWEWQGHLSNGYGQMRANGKPDYAHRISYILQKGEIPAGLCVLHKCDNRRCVNPDHLFLGTNAENTADKVSKNRQARGVSHGMSRLTDQDVIAIFALRESGVTHRKIATKFGVDRSLVGQVLAGNIWTETILRDLPDHILRAALRAYARELYREWKQRKSRAA